MLRITQIENGNGHTLRLEGKLAGAWAEEVRRCWHEYKAANTSAPFRVNLRELTYADSVGRDLLVEMQRQGVCLIEASDFIRHLLRDDSVAAVRPLAEPTKSS